VSVAVAKVGTLAHTSARLLAGVIETISKGISVVPALSVVILKSAPVESIAE